MPGMPLINMLSGADQKKLGGLENINETNEFQKILDGQLTESELDDLIAGLESLGEMVDPKLLKLLRQAAEDGKALPFSAITLPSELAQDIPPEFGSEPAPVMLEGRATPGQGDLAQLSQQASFAARSTQPGPEMKAALAATASAPLALNAPAEFDLDLAGVDLRAVNHQMSTLRGIGDTLQAAQAAQTRMSQVSVRVGEPGWHQAVADRVVWLLGRDQQGVQLKLNPAHLGPMEVKLSLNQDQASVTFLSSHAAVREALEQAVPRLRDMLGQQDIQLVQVNVDQRQGQNSQGAEQGADGKEAAANNNATGQGVDAEGSQPEGQVMLQRGLVDTYA